MGTETVEITNNTGITDWFEIADPTHQYVHISSNQSGSHIRIQDLKPAPQDLALPVRDVLIGNVSQSSVVYDALIQIRDARSSVWVRLANNATVVAVRGDAKISQF